MKKFYFTLMLAFGMNAGTWADDWLGRLPDELYLSTISIPGSHDTGTGNGFSSSLGATFGQTQDIDMAEQWACGVRAFDLRPALRDGYLQVNHGTLATLLRFDDALYLLRDSLIAHPTEFAVVHLLHADEGDYGNVGYTYEELLLELLQGDELKDYMVDFRRDLTLKDMRGKILILSRDEYADEPVGGFFHNWCGYIDWNVQTQGKITGAGTGTEATATLYMQDLSDTHGDGVLDEKLEAINTMLDFSTNHVTSDPSDVVYVFNFASAYSKVSLGISTSNGYRDNATYTNARFIEYLQEKEPGPTGVVMIDYVGVDQSGTYATRGKELVDTLIANNFKYLVRMNDGAYELLLDELSTVESKLSTTTRRINNYCADVASDYSDELAAISAAIEQIRAEVDSLHDAVKLTYVYKIDSDALTDSLDQIYKDARAAQAAYEEEGLDVQTVKGAGSEVTVTAVYSLTGEQLEAPQPGTVNLIKYSDGTVRKVVVP